MKILENRGICIGLMLVLVVCGFLLGGYKGLAGAYQKASDVFFLGEDGDGVCVAKDMAERAGALTNLQTVAKKYLAAEDAAAREAADAVNAYTRMFPHYSRPIPVWKPRWRHCTESWERKTFPIKMKAIGSVCTRSLTRAATPSAMTRITATRQITIGSCKSSLRT